MVIVMVDTHSAQPEPSLSEHGEMLQCALIHLFDPPELQRSDERSTKHADEMQAIDGRCAV